MQSLSVSLYLWADEDDGKSNLDYKKCQSYLLLFSFVNFDVETARR